MCESLPMSTSLLSSTTVAIKMAKNNGTLRVEECFNERLQMPYWAISDDSGLIEVALSKEEAEKRVGL
jgi:hypothetical protein